MTDSQNNGPQREMSEPGRSAPKLNVDASNINAGYSNFCRVTGTPEEVVLDFGMNDQPFGESDRPIQITHRVVLNYFTAKRMLAALQMTIGRHEQAFGVLETDIRKRVTPTANAASD